MVNLMIDRFEAGGKIIKSVNVSDNNSKTKNRVGLKSPLLHIMQSNEKKFSANIKAKKEKDTIKKLKKREKEAKSDSERKRIKERAELQRLFDKIVAKKVVESGSKCAKIVASPDIGASKCLNFKNQPNDDIEDSRESADENSRKGLLYSKPELASLGENSRFSLNSHGGASKSEHNDSEEEGAMIFREKMAKFGPILKKK